MVVGVASGRVSPENGRAMGGKAADLTVEAATGRRIVLLAVRPHPLLGSGGVGARRTFPRRFSPPRMMMRRRLVQEKSDPSRRRKVAAGTIVFFADAVAIVAVKIMLVGLMLGADVSNDDSLEGAAVEAMATFEAQPSAGNYDADRGREKGSLHSQFGRKPR